MKSLPLLFSITAIAIFTAALPLQAQTSEVSGEIRNEDSEPLPGVTLLLKQHPEEGASFQTGTATDPQGNFIFQNLPAGTYTLETSMIGYHTHHETLELESGDSRNLTIQLSAKDYSFQDDVVITATRTEQSVATAPASISIVSSVALEREPVADLTDVVRNIAGISVSAGSQGRREIQMRGMDASHTLLLMDGRRVNSSEAVFRHNDYDLGMLPIDAIDRIEVVRGGMSALYGSEALGGVVNVITKPASNQWSSKISSEFQSPMEGDGGQEYKTSFYSSGALLPNRLGLTLTGTLNHRNIWNGWSDEPLVDGGSVVTRPDGSEVSRNDLATLEGRNDHNGRAKLTWTPSENQTIETEYGQSYQTRSGEYFIRGWGEADTQINRRDLVLTHKNDFSWGNSVLRSYGEWIETESDNLEQTNTIIEGHANAFLGNHTLTIGGEARWLDLKAPAEFENGQASANQQALYLQDEFQISESLKLLTGARLDHHENFGFHATPRSYLVLSATDQLTFKGGVGTAFKAPTLRQLSDESIVTSCRGGCLIVGDPDLNPETSTNYELSLNYKAPVWGGSLTAFQNDVDNLIDTPRGDGVTPIGIDPDTGLEMFVPRNVNQARIRGIESTAYINFGAVGRLTVNHTFLNAEDLSNDEPLQYRPRHSINTQLFWYASHAMTFFVRGRYTGDQVTSAGEIEPYTLFDLGGSWRLSDHFRIRTGVTNIANTRTDNPLDSYSFVERPRSLYLGLSAEF